MKAALGLPLSLYIRRYEEELERAKEAADERALNNLVQMEQALEHCVKMCEKLGLPEDFGSVFRGILMSTQNLRQEPKIPRLDREKIQRQAIERLAFEQNAGVWVDWQLSKPDQPPSTQFRMVDFCEVLEMAVEIDAKQEPGTGALITVLQRDGKKRIMKDREAIAFLRYLHFAGLFEIQLSKVACPDCGADVPQDCLQCGGIGWTLKFDSETMPEVIT